MSNKKAIIVMAASTAIFTALLILSLLRIDPATSLWLGFVAVTVAMLLFLWSLIGTALLTGRAWRKKNKAVAASLRQASFLSILMVLALYLQRFDLLTWWHVLLLVAIAALAEMFFVGKEEVEAK